MTDTELRELDARVAIEVFGRKRYRYVHGARAHLIDPGVIAEGNQVLYGLVGPEVTLADVQHTPIPRYSTSIGDAWQVVEKFLESGWHFSLTSWFDRWVAKFESPGRGRLVSNAGLEQPKTDTAPLAIVLAALATVKESSASSSRSSS